MVYFVTSVVLLVTHTSHLNDKLRRGKDPSYCRWEESVYEPADKSVQQEVDHIRLLVKEKDDEEADGGGEQDCEGTDKTKS